MRVLIYICCVVTSFITLTSSFPLTQRSPDNVDNESQATVSKKSMNLKLLQKELARLIAQDDVSKKTVRLKNLKTIKILPLLVELLAMTETQNVDGSTTNHDRRRRAVNATVDTTENDIPNHTSHKPSTTTFHPSTESNIEVLYKPAGAGDDDEDNANAGGKDSAGFIFGLLSNFVSSSSGGGGGNGNKADGSSSFLSKVFEVKMAIFRSLFSIVTSLLSSSSAHG